MILVSAISGKVNGQTLIYAASRLPPLDLRIKRNINDKQDWYVKVYNLFDKEYGDELFYPASGQTVLVGADFKFVSPSPYFRKAYTGVGVFRQICPRVSQP